MISLVIRGDSGVGNFVEFLVVHNCERDSRDLLAFTRAAALNMNSSSHYVPTQFMTLPLA
jgi:hypothetical protein